MSETRTNTESEKLINQRNKIITDLFNSGEIQKKVKGILYRNHVSIATDIHSDLLQEVFYHLSKKTPEFIVEVNNDNPKRLVAIATSIAVFVGVANDKNKHPDFPRNLMNKILFGSNLSINQNMNISSTETFEDGCVPILVDESTEENPEAEMWTVIKEELSEEERDHLDEYLNFIKTKGRTKKELKEKNEQLLKRIKEIITKYKYNV